MPTRPHVRRQAASGTPPGLAGDSEESRAFLQDRLRLWAKVGFFFTFVPFVLAEILPRLGLGVTRPGISGLLNLAVVLVWGGAWLGLRTRPLARGVLHAVDAGIVLVGCTLTVISVVLEDPVQSLTYMPVLIVFIGSVGRAIFVPSTTLRTALVSTGIAVCVQGVASAFGPTGALARMLPVEALRAWTLVFSASAVLLAAVASQVIYGLRQQVRKALQLGQYTLEEKLGEGGMGTVYRARHALLRRPTAVKLLPPEKVGESSLERFEREVQLTALLSHPNTVAIFDYGRTPDGIFYYAMEYLEGVDLESLVRLHGPQPPARVVHILRQVCGSLGEAHQRGLVHRDIKPANIVLCERGGTPDVAKVLDFGLVKDLDEAHGITRAEAVTGTPLYLAPEAIRGEDVDGRADLYAVGAVGYFLLAGRNVFEGKTLVEICGHHLHAAPVPPSQQLGRPVPPKLESVILSCLQKDLEDRPATARDLAHALEACDDVEAWTERQARSWWDDRGETPGAVGSGSTDAGHGTLMPSLELRDAIDQRRGR